MGRSKFAAVAVLLGGLCSGSAPSLAQDRMVPASSVRGQGGGFHAGQPGGSAGHWGRGPGRWMRGDGDRGRNWRWRHRGGRDIQGFYWGGGVAYPEQDWPSAAGTGFFADGEAVRVGNRVVYDYDRGYPYQHRSKQYAAVAAADAPPPSGDYRCTVEWVPGGRREPASPVRVCRR